jgi:hypothetical protein
VRELLETAPSHELSFEEKIGMLVDREWTERDNRRLARRLKDAKLGVRASLEDVVCDPGRGVDKATVRQLATCAWVRAKKNVIAIGPTGIGKSFLGAALAEGACRHGLRALFVRVPRLVEELAVARISGVAEVVAPFVVVPSRVVSEVARSSGSGAGARRPRAKSSPFSPREALRRASSGHDHFLLRKTPLPR